MNRSSVKLVILFLILVGSVLGIIFVKSPENGIFALLLGMFGMQLLSELRS